MVLWALKNTQLLYRETSLRFFTVTDFNSSFRQMDSEAFISINILRFYFFKKKIVLYKKKEHILIITDVASNLGILELDVIISGCALLRKCMYVFKWKFLSLYGLSSLHAWLSKQLCGEFIFKQ